MNLDYFRMINNTYKSQSKQETDLYLLNRHVDECFADTIDYHVVKRNGEPFELLIIKDTDGNTFKKKIKSKHSEPFNLGDYIEWNDQIWIVTLIDTDDKTYHSGYMYQCTVLLRWQNSKSEIIERWAYSEDFTKYSTGIKSNNTLTVGDYQYGLTLPVDEETKFIKRDKRFPIDFEGVEPPDVYKLTNRKILLAATDNNSFGRGGILTWTLSFDEFNTNTDKKINLNNGENVWICNYIDPSSLPSISDETSDLWVMELEYSTLKIKPLDKEYTIIAHLYDKNNTEITDGIEYEWTIESNIDSYLTVKKNSNILNVSLSSDCEDYGEIIKVSCMSKYTGQSVQIELEVLEVW